MYKTFFGLTRNPFEISPDPYFLFATARHNEALASIVHGVLRHKGFIVVTGEVGTGKTLLVRCLLELLRRQEIASANIYNPCLSPLEYLRYNVADMGINTTTVLIVDEAQDLGSELLEEIRLLTNLETSQQKLLQIVLTGQPELDQKMDSPDLRQLKQRIAMRCHLEPMQEEETKSYILRRLQRAGANSHATTMFPAETVECIYRYSSGIPRLINTLCENALIAAYAEKAQVVCPPIIDEVAKDLRINVSIRPPIVTSAATNGQTAVAKSLLQLVEALERIARNAEARESRSDQGVKIV